MRRLHLLEAATVDPGHNFALEDILAAARHTVEEILTLTPSSLLQALRWEVARIRSRRVA